MFLSYVTRIDSQWLPLTGSAAKGPHHLASWGAEQDKVMGPEAGYLPSPILTLLGHVCYGEIYGYTYVRHTTYNFSD